jgi:hypothetical protein
MYTNHDTLNVPCPQCEAEVGKWCVPAHKRYKYDPRYYVHGKRQVAFEIYLTGVKQGADKVVRLTFSDPSYGTDPTLVKDVQADIKAVLLILRKYGSASAA